MDFSSQVRLSKNNVALQEPNCPFNRQTGFSVVKSCLSTRKLYVQDVIGCYNGQVCRSTIRICLSSVTLDNQWFDRLRINQMRLSPITLESKQWHSILKGETSLLIIKVDFWKSRRRSDGRRCLSASPQPNPMSHNEFGDPTVKFNVQQSNARLEPNKPMFREPNLYLET